MNFEIPSALIAEQEAFKKFLDLRIAPKVTIWYRDNRYPREFFRTMAEGDGYGFSLNGGIIEKRPALREALFTECLASLSPGLAVAVLAHIDLGVMGLHLYGSPELKVRYARAVLSGEKIMCIGNTERDAGSDVAGIAMTAEKVEGGWRLNGGKAYVTNGNIADLAVITAVTDPDAERTRRISMFLVDLTQAGVHRKPLNKAVWIPADLTRLRFDNVFVPDDHLMGSRGRGLQQVLNIFTHSRVAIAALTLGTASGAFDLAVRRAEKREMFGRRLISFQAKAFEMADFYARLTATRLVIYRTCEKMDKGNDFRLDAAMAKYLAVELARQLTAWAADLFGAASVMREHPIHKYPMDAWAASLGEGTQDVQKLVIFREMLKRRPRA